MKDKLEQVRKSVPKPALLEAIAEEATEVAQAALKASRVIRGENPTPVTWEEAVANLNEEITDLELCIDALDCPTDWNVYRRKLDRWIKRLEDKEVDQWPMRKRA